MEVDFGVDWVCPILKVICFNIQSNQVYTVQLVSRLLFYNYTSEPLNIRYDQQTQDSTLRDYQ